MGVVAGIKALVSTPDIIKHGANAIDALHLSKEEEAALNEKYILAKAKLLESSGPSAITRRLLAIIVGGYWLVCNLIWLVLWMLMSFAEIGSSEMLDYLSAHVEDRVNPSFMLVMVFYFGVRALEGIGKK